MFTLKVFARRSTCTLYFPTKFLWEAARPLHLPSLPPPPPPLDTHTAPHVMLHRKIFNDKSGSLKIVKDFSATFVALIIGT